MRKLYTQEAEIGRIAVQSQTWANSSQDLILKNPLTETSIWWSDSNGKSTCLASVRPNSNPTATKKENNIDMVH
jgi:hypothetical protein